MVSLQLHGSGLSTKAPRLTFCARDLYIQAIQAMQNMDSDDDLSWFQLAGIHGMPFNEWDGAGPKQGDGWLGYCPHGVRLPTA